jgi:hypothetical protein
MPPAGRRPVLLVEGEGDRVAVPELVRTVCHRLDLHDVQPAPHPIKCGGISKLRADGTLERFVTYACQRQDGDSVLLVLDCEDDCPVDIVRELTRRAALVVERYNKKAGIALLRREFETLFLASIESISLRYPAYGWELAALDPADDPELYRGAKERLRSAMKKSKYRETRDQVRFVTALDLDLLAERSRPYRHLESVLLWLHTKNDSFIHPQIGE